MPIQHGEWSAFSFLASQLQDSRQMSYSDTMSEESRFAIESSSYSVTFIVHGVIGSLGPDRYFVLKQSDKNGKRVYGSLRSLILTKSCSTFICVQQIIAVGILTAEVKQNPNKANGMSSKV